MTGSAIATLTEPSGVPTVAAPRVQRERRTPVTGPIVVAAKGSDEMASTLAIAQQISLRLGAEMLVMSVVPPMLVYGVPTEMQGPSLELDREAVEERSSEIGKLLSAHTLPGVRCKADVRLGQPAIEICDTATELDATLIIVGAAPHLRRRHIVAGQRAAQILHGATTPVLSVAPWMKDLPENVVAAIDYNPASLNAAQLAARLLRSNGSMTLVHVVPPSLAFPGLQIGDGSLRSALSTELESVANNLRPFIPATAKIQTVVLTGDVATEILNVADRVNADLIALGTRSHSALRRAFVGSVATDVFHTTLTSVLASPPPSVTRQVELALDTSGTARSTDDSEFAAVLDSFSRTNAGRIARLEEDDPAIGAQIQMEGLQFLGASFDARDKSVQIMFGSSPNGKAHFTRAITDVKSLAVARVSYAGGSALELSHGASKTLVIVGAQQ